MLIRIFTLLLGKKETGLPDDFNSWFAISMLHLWMVLYKTREELVRIRIQTGIP